MTPAPDRLAAVVAEERQKMISGAVLLDDVRDYLGRFVAFPSPEALAAVALWAAHAHLVMAGENTPRLALLSPEPGSGKTRVLEVLELLSPSPMFALSASAPAIFRSMAAAPRTLLFDEVDAIFGRHGKDDPAEDLRALLNAGHRRGATIPRCVGPAHDVVDFPVFGAVALAGLGDLPDTLMSRSVIVRMRRRLPTEAVEPFRRRMHAPEGEELRERLTCWADQVAEIVGDAWPAMPDGVTDRPADVWEPLLAIADAAGGHWPCTARTACTALVAVAESREASLGVRLLSDLRAVFSDAGTDRLATDEVLRRLHALDEAPWQDLRGRPLDARGLAWRLRGYDVRPHQFRDEHDGKARGYSLYGTDAAGGGLADAFARYLAPSGPGGTGTAGTAGTSQVSDPERVPDDPSRTGTADPCTGTANRSGTDRELVTRAVPLVPAVPDQGTPDGAAYWSTADADAYLAQLDAEDAG